MNNKPLPKVITGHETTYVTTVDSFGETVVKDVDWGNVPVEVLVDDFVTHGWKVLASYADRVVLFKNVSGQVHTTYIVSKEL